MTKQRPGRPIKIEQRDKVTKARQYSLRLLADKVIETLGYCEHISHTYIKDILSKKSLRSNVKIWLYCERFPVVCFDERPCFLIGGQKV